MSEIPAFSRYLKVEKGSVVIDRSKVKEEERYDGRWVLTTNTDLPVDEVALRYKELWQVEMIFREAKSTLQTRPIYHKCDLTILGHVFCSFLALLIMHELKKREKNMAKLSSTGFTYILGVKMRLKKKAMREVLSRAGRYKEVAENLKVKEVLHDGKRYVVAINPEEQRKDAADRMVILAALEEKLKTGASSLVGNTGF